MALRWTAAGMMEADGAPPAESLEPRPRSKLRSPVHQLKHTTTNALEENPEAA
jgi:hypothetical protein